MIIDGITLAFIIVAFLEIMTAISIFLFRDILRATLLLTFVFLLNSLLFMIVGQTLLAIVQLFIMVGGISTFLFVGVASAELSQFSYTRFVMLNIVWVLLSLIMIYPTLNMQSQVVQANQFTIQNISSSLGSDIGIFYIMLVVVFGVSLSAILLLKLIGVKQ